MPPREPSPSPEPSPEELADQAAALGAALLEQAQSSGDPQLLDLALASLDAAADLTPTMHPDAAGRASNLGLALRLRADRDRDRDDLDQAVALGRWAVGHAAPEDPGLAGYLANFGDSLQSRYERSGTVADLVEAADGYRRAVTAGREHPAYPLIMSGYGSCLALLHGAVGPPWSIDEAVAACRSAAGLAPEGSPWHASCQANLAVTSGIRAAATGSGTDLDDAIVAGRAALAATPDDHPALAGRLSNLGGALLERYIERGDRADLNDAVAAAGRAATMAGATDPYLDMYLSNLGFMLRLRVDAFGDDDDLQAAVDTGLLAVERTPAGHPARPRRLSNTAMTLLTRYERHPAGAGEDLDLAVTLIHAAVREAGPEHPDRGLYQSQLGLLLRHRYLRTRDADALEAAIAEGRKGLAAMPDGHPDRAGAGLNLAEAYLERSQLPGTGRDDDVDLAVTHWRESAGGTGAPVDLCLAAARRWAQAEAGRGRWAAAARGCERAVALLPLLAWRGIGRDDQEQRLAAQAGLGGEVTAIAVAGGDPERAVSLADQSRNILWTQLLETQAEVDQLRSRAPELSAELRRVAAALAARSPTELAWYGSRPA